MVCPDGDSSRDLDFGEFVELGGPILMSPSDGVEFLRLRRFWELVELPASIAPD